jgi:hypothetical protein
MFYGSKIFRQLLTECEGEIGIMHITVTNMQKSEITSST